MYYSAYLKSYGDQPEYEKVKFKTTHCPVEFAREFIKSYYSGHGELKSWVQSRMADSYNITSGFSDGLMVEVLSLDKLSWKEWHECNGLYVRNSQCQ